MNSHKKEMDKASSKQLYATNALVIITCINVLLGILMVQKVFPIWLGMTLSFSIMGIVCAKAHKDLLDDGETAWESKEKFHERRNK